MLHGVGVSRGVAIGRAVCLDEGQVDIQRFEIAPAERVAEQDRLARALAVVGREFDLFKQHIPANAPTELEAMLAVHHLILADPALTQKPRLLIETRGLNAEWALSETADALAAQFDAMDDQYLRERKRDVMQVVARVQKALIGAGPAVLRDGGGDARLLIAADLDPADMIQLRGSSGARPRFGAFCTQYGGLTSHTAILARSMNLPAVTGIHEALQWIRDGDWVIVDGNHGVVIVEPDEVVLEHYRRRIALENGERAALMALTPRAAVTRDGRTIALLANIELPADANAALDVNAAGIGLFRSEFLFMNRDDEPGEDEQFEAYREVVRIMAGRPVTIRTIDVGADKTLQSGPTPGHDAENPALGLRAIRYSLSRPEMFRLQLRAILRAAAEGPVRILLPMLSSAAEIDAALDQLALAEAELTVEGVVHGQQTAVGGMIEIPAAALALGAFTRRLDFLSIGTNDLIQYTLAIDRADNAVADLYDPLHPAVLSLIAHTIREGARAGKEVSVCGEMAGDVRYTTLLLGMGLTQFSMQAAQIPYIKAQLLEADYASAQSIAAEALGESDSRAIRALLARAPAATRATATIGIDG
ncbi:phosphoenolpyruvate--protein phosphotransferase [soil metagenome]